MLSVEHSAWCYKARRPKIQMNCARVAWRIAITSLLVSSKNSD